MTKRLLIVDDQTDISFLVKTSLEELAGWQVTTVESGIQALSMVKTEPYDAIILDVSMPDLDGISIFKQMQSEEATKSIPVIFLTAKVLDSDMLLFKQIGVTGTITKPFSPNLLWRQIGQILGWVEPG